MQNAITAQFLREAYGAESMAYMRYKAWGNAAKSEGYPNVSRLFEAVAFSEQVHASNHFTRHADIADDFLVASLANFGKGSTADNLVGAVAGETYEYEQLYPAFEATAKQHGEGPAEQSFSWARQSEEVHARLFNTAREAVKDGNDMQLREVNVCDNCGFTLEGEAPDKCPVCSVPKARFRAF